LRRIQKVDAQAQPAQAQPVQAAVDDGRDHPLDPRVIPLQRIGGWIFTAVVAGTTMFPLFITLLAADDMPRWLRLLLPVVWLALAGVNAWWAWRWPPIAYRHTWYRVDSDGIEIRRGVYFRTVINVPRSRVQHTDVSQGPIARHFGLGTLAIYTAGTEHARVELAGLEHGLAMRIREHLLPSGASDAV
jgi:membrane protein YdbS with pleckstrin-like domain